MAVGWQARTVNITMSDFDAGVVKRKGKCHVPRSLCMRIRVVFWYTWFFWFKSSSICTFTNSHSGLPWNYVKWILLYLSLPLNSIIWFSMFATVCKGQEQTSLRRLMVRSRSWFSAISFSFSLRSVIVWWVWNCTSLRSCSFSIMVLFVFCDIIFTTSDKTY